MDWSSLANTSMLDGWLPWTLQLIGVAVLAGAVGLRSRRWWFRWVPAIAVAAALSVLAVRWYVTSEGLVGDPAPILFWMWTALTGTAVAVLAFGWRGAGWGRRAASVLAIPACLLCTVLLLNIWVGYVRTAAAVGTFVDATPPPNQADLAEVRRMAAHNIVPHSGRIVPVETGWQASGFRHRTELVYLPPAWFASSPPPPLPVVMMIGGEFGSSGDWIWAGNAQEVADDYAQANNGNAPVLVFVDKGGTFTQDTECVNGSRGNAADHLTRDVVPYMVSTFGVSADSANWGVAGWSMGGTCALDLAVTHPELFGTFIDIDGDIGPNTGTREQTVARLFGGDEKAWETFDPITAMTRHGGYRGMAGVFVVEASEDPQRVDQHAIAANQLSDVSAANGIDCSILEIDGRHDWAAGAAGFKQAFPWLVSRMGTPGVPRVERPGRPVVLAGESVGDEAEWATPAVSPP